MKNNLISIIIPVYNAEKNLRKCIESIIAQTYHNLEIILVDDGSKDGSLTICNEYAEKDNRIVVIHKENGGASSARNCGLKASKGDYIGFIDSDDYIEKDMYQILMNEALKNNTDMSMCGYYEITGNQRIEKNICEKSEVVSNTEILKNIFTFKHMGVLWNKLIKKEVFLSDGKLIEFDESVHFCEDVLILTKILSCCKKISMCSGNLYNYIISSESLCHGGISERKLTIINALDLIVEECHKNFPSVAGASESFALGHKIDIVLKLNDADNIKNKENYQKKIKNNLKNQLKRVNRNSKIKILIALNVPFVYKILKSLKKKKNKFKGGKK